MPFDILPQTTGLADTPTTRGNLAADTITSLRTYFRQQNHSPSADHWDALRDIAETLEAMAEGLSPRSIYLSSCDPGTGKTQTVVRFARALVSDPAYRDVGIVVCVGRIEEAKNFAAELGVPPDRFAVLTSDTEANATSNTMPTDAQVLITTQQRIEMQCRGTSFAAATQFYYRGQPRQVRVWDEAWLPGTACVSTCNFDPLMECAPEGGQNQAAVLTVCRVC